MKNLKINLWLAVFLLVVSVSCVKNIVEPAPVHIRDGVSGTVFLLTDFYNVPVDGCNGVPTISGDVYSIHSEVIEGDTLYSDVNLTNKLLGFYGATNVVGLLPEPVSFDYFKLNNGVVGSFGTCP